MVALVEILRQLFPRAHLHPRHRTRRAGRRIGGDLRIEVREAVRFDIIDIHDLVRRRCNRVVVAERVALRVEDGLRDVVVECSLAVFEAGSEIADHRTVLKNLEPVDARLASVLGRAVVVALEQVHI